MKLQYVFLSTYVDHQYCCTQGLDTTVYSIHSLGKGQRSLDWENMLMEY